MDFARPEIDLGKELTCSICTELLYQPLTLLDCLHTFCGACLNEWFSWQATAAENAPTPPAPGTPVFTCPSCRAPVRDTRHNATVATLLDMFLAANPDKARSDEDKTDMNMKYKRGDSVLPRLNILEKTPEQRRLDEQERMLIDEVRQMSLREAVESSPQPPTSRRRRESRSRDRSAMRSRDPSREPNRGTRARDARERARRQATDEEPRHRAEQTVIPQPEGPPRDDGQQRLAEVSEMSRRHVEHQSSLRSLISSSDPGSLDIEREIEEFARQIQEEGLLDGLDLDNLDLSNNDELSRKITEAYRRRQRQRTRNEAARRSNTSRDPPHSDPATPDLHQRQADSSHTSSRSASRQRTQSRSQSNTRQADDRSRPPLSSSAGHLEVQQEPTTRHRRRTTSGGRSSTVPAPPVQAETRAATRSQTDLSLRPNSADTSSRPSIGTELRSSSTPSVGASTQAASFNARMVGAGLGVVQPGHIIAQPEQVGEQSKRLRRPADLMLGPIGPSWIPTAGQASPGLDSPSLSSPGHRRSASQLYPEPSLTCQRCRKGHIEYELHYNCYLCRAGDWNICLDCYRRGKGCLHWFGFGHSAWSKWEKARRDTESNIPEPHTLTANRYVPPKIIPGGADGRQTLTTQNPADRLQSGTFCSRCLAWTNECYWMCGTCNEGDWGFCNDCVNQGRCCTHPLLPLTYSPPSHVGSPTSISSPRSPSSPHLAATVIAPSPGIRGNSPFRPLAFTTQCDICKFLIPPAQTRFHCFSCKSSAVADAHHGDYDICQNCYGGLAVDKTISPENGPCGWRRCPQGHRMAVVGFQDGSGGLWRSVVHDSVGGRKLQQQQHHNDEDDASPSRGGLQTWYWFEGNRKVERLVAQDVRATAVPADAAASEGRLGTAVANRFPPDGGGGMKAVAKWAWYPAPGADDELLFPRGAEIREIDDVNGEWFHGVYLGAKGVFPAPYVQVLDG